MDSKGSTVCLQCLFIIFLFQLCHLSITFLPRCKPHYCFKEISAWSESYSVMSDSLWPHGCSLWNSPGGVGGPSLLQMIFPALESNPGLLHCRWIFTSWAIDNVKKDPCLWCFNSWSSLWRKCSFAGYLESLLAPLLWVSNEMSYLRAFLSLLCKTDILVPLMFKLLMQSYLFCITVRNLHFYFFIIFLFPLNLHEWRNSAFLFTLVSPIHVWYTNTY